LATFGSGTAVNHRFGPPHPGASRDALSRGVLVDLATNAAAQKLASFAAAALAQSTLRDFTYEGTCRG